MMRKYVCEECLVIPFIVFISSFSLLEMNTVTQDQEWPTFMHDYENTGFSGSSAPDSMYLLWSYDTGQRLFGSPIVSGGIVYQAGRGCVFALDEETGKMIWSSGVQVVGSTPCKKGDFLYVGTCNGVASLNAQTGEVAWEVKLAEFECGLGKYDFPTFLASCPVTTEKGIIMCTHENWEMTFPYPYEPPPEGINRVVLLDLENGALLWEYALGDRGGYSPALVSDAVVINSDDANLLDLSTGKCLGSYPVEDLYDSSPVISDGKLIVVSKQEGIVSLFEIETGALLWERTLEKKVTSTPAIYNDTIVVVTCDGTIIALNKKTGDIIWRRMIEDSFEGSISETAQNLVSSVNSSPAIAGNKVYVGLRTGVFLCLRLDTGKTLWKYEPGSAIVASPAVADGKVFIASTNGKVYCFGENPEPPILSQRTVIVALGSISLLIGLFVAHYLVQCRNK